MCVCCLGVCMYVWVCLSVSGTKNLGCLDNQDLCISASQEQGTRDIIWPGSFTPPFSAKLQSRRPHLLLCPHAFHMCTVLPPCLCAGPIIITSITWKLSGYCFLPLFCIILYCLYFSYFAFSLILKVIYTLVFILSATFCLLMNWHLMGVNFIFILVLLFHRSLILWQCLAFMTIS